MARLIWTEPALQDLGSIAEYIALDKPAAAQRYRALASSVRPALDATSASAARCSLSV